MHADGRSKTVVTKKMCYGQTVLRRRSGNLFLAPTVHTDIQIKIHVHTDTYTYMYIQINIHVHTRVERFAQFRVRLWPVAILRVIPHVRVKSLGFACVCVK